MESQGLKLRRIQFYSGDIRNQISVLKNSKAATKRLARGVYEVVIFIARIYNIVSET